MVIWSAFLTLTKESSSLIALQNVISDRTFDFPLSCAKIIEELNIAGMIINNKIYFS